MRRSRLGLVTLLAATLAGCPGAPSAVGPKSDAVRPETQHEDPTAPAEIGRLPQNAHPTRYRLAFDLDPSQEAFAGVARIDVTIPAETRVIELHGESLTVAAASALVAGKSRKARVKALHSHGRLSADRLLLSFDEPIPRGTATIEIDYAAPFSPDMAGVFSVDDGQASYVFTQFEPSDARRAFPCFDEPSEKTPFDIEITVPKGQIALSNAPEIERKAAAKGDGTTFRFATTEPLPTYLVALAAGPLEIREGEQKGTPIRLVTTRGKTKLGARALETAGRALAFLEGYFDAKYPYKKLDLVAVPDLSADAMEHPGLVTFRDDYILLDPASASAPARLDMAAILAHELAHQWFGNQVTMRWWDELWLNEGFATWMTPKVQDALASNDLASTLYVQDKHLAMRLDELPSSRPVRAAVVSKSEAEDVFDAITYDKGASLAGMLEAFLGEEVFRKALRAHVAAHKNGHASSEDLFRALGEASGKDVAAIGKTFLDAPGLPLVQADLLCAKDKPSRIELKLSPPKAWDGKTFVVPVCVAYAGGKEPACAPLTDQHAIELPGACPAWIHPNAGDHGHYRFKLDPAQQKALTANAKHLGTKERAGLAANTRALAERGDLEASAILDLTSALADERHPAVLAELASNLEFLRKMLPDAPARAALARFVSAAWQPLGKKLGWTSATSDDDATRLARRTVLQTLSVIAEDAWAKGEAKTRAAAWLKDPKSRDPETGALALFVAARSADEAMFQALVAALEDAETPEERLALAEALGHIEDAALLGRALDLSLKGKLSEYETATAFLAAVREPSSLLSAFAWLEGRYRELRGTLGAVTMLEISASVGETCSVLERDAALSFFVQTFEAQGPRPRRLALFAEQADVCIASRARDVSALKARLKIR